ncbi:unnamed protein product [Prorocentrum cordatum]|uniref:Reverse transcriptase domain-containing protein n=1 Tax=Prorocentrum cordatum TaxID=2364126 RepID=A0ABN9TG12_9DINO|nr:unnamed protein product [Polarella glacialis]
MPECLDEVGHSFLLEALLRKGVDRAIAAWRVREARSSVLRLRLGGVDVPPVCVARGIPRGSRHGPSPCAAVIRCCTETAWKSCRRDRLGYRLGDSSMPFVLFCDNIFIFARDANDFLEIHSRLQFALVMGGWKLPGDRLAYQMDKCVGGACGTQLKECKEKPRGTFFKALGPMINAACACHADATVKRRGFSAAIERQRSLWSCPRVSRQKKLSLMCKVVASSYSWCVGAWIANQRELSSLGAAFTKAAKSALRVPRRQSDADEARHRACVRVLRETIIKAGLSDVDVYVLSRARGYAGHLARAIRRDPGHLVGAVVRRRDSEWSRNVTGAIDAKVTPAVLAVTVAHDGNSGGLRPRQTPAGSLTGDLHETNELHVHGMSDGLHQPADLLDLLEALRRNSETANDTANVAAQPRAGSAALDPIAIEDRLSAVFSDRMQRATQRVLQETAAIMQSATSVLQSELQLAISQVQQHNQRIDGVGACLRDLGSRAHIVEQEQQQLKADIERIQSPPAMAEATLPTLDMAALAARDRPPGPRLCNLPRRALQKIERRMTEGALPLPQETRGVCQQLELPIASSPCQRKPFHSMASLSLAALEIARASCGASYEILRVHNDGIPPANVLASAVTWHSGKPFGAARSGAGAGPSLAVGGASGATAAGPAANAQEDDHMPAGDLEPRRTVTAERGKLLGLPWWDTLVTLSSRELEPLGAGEMSALYGKGFELLRRMGYSSGPLGTATAGSASSRLAASVGAGSVSSDAVGVPGAPGSVAGAAGGAAGGEASRRGLVAPLRAEQRLGRAGLGAEGRGTEADPELRPPTAAGADRPIESLVQEAIAAMCEAGDDEEAAELRRLASCCVGLGFAAAAPVPPYPRAARRRRPAGPLVGGISEDSLEERAATAATLKAICAVGFPLEADSDYAALVSYSPERSCRVVGRARNGDEPPIAMIHVDDQPKFHGRGRRPGLRRCVELEALEPISMSYPYTSTLLRKGHGEGGICFDFGRSWSGNCGTSAAICCLSLSVGDPPSRLPERVCARAVFLERNDLSFHVVRCPGGGVSELWRLPRLATAEVDGRSRKAGRERAAEYVGWCPGLGPARVSVSRVFE